MSGFSGAKPSKLAEQEWELEFPSVDQYKGQFTSDMQAWEDVVDSFPENVQTEIDGILLRIEEAENVNTTLLRQLATIFKGNSDDDRGLKIAKWIKIMADFGDFFPDAVDAIVDMGSGEEEGEEEKPE